MKLKSFIKELLFYLFLGIIAGAFMFLAEKVELSSAATSIYGILAVLVPILFVLVNMAAIFVSDLRFRKAKKSIENHNEENEDELTEIENS